MEGSVLPAPTFSNSDVKRKLSHQSRRDIDEISVDGGASVTASGKLSFSCAPGLALNDEGARSSPFDKMEEFWPSVEVKCKLASANVEPNDPSSHPTKHDKNCRHQECIFGNVNRRAHTHHHEQNLPARSRRPLSSNGGPV